MVEKLLKRFFRDYDGFLKLGFPMIRDSYRQKSPFIGKRISIVSLDSQVAGLARDITDDGALLIETDDGLSTKITLGDVQC